MKYKNYFIFIITIIIIFIFINYLFLYKDKLLKNPHKYSLNEHGFALYKNILDDNEINLIKKLSNDTNYKKIKEIILNNKKIILLKNQTTNKDYIFQDYIYIIKKSSVHTCHRDNNGQFFNKNQKYPSYTMLIYLEDMDKCLGVIPKSHINYYYNSINIFDNVQNIVCNKGDVIIFNANLIHVGTMNKNDDNLRIQLKITHKDDIKNLIYFQNYNKILNEDNKLPKLLRKAQKKITCTFPIMSNLAQKDIIKSSRGSDNGDKISYSQKIYSYLVSGNKNFYDLPNAF